MTYTPSKIYPSLKYFQWGTPTNPNPRLARSISATSTTLYITVAPYDYAGSLITGDFLMGIENSDGYVETVYVPPGGGALSGTTYIITGAVRGVRLSGLDYTTGDTTLAVAHDQDDAVFCNISAVIQALVAYNLVFPNFANATERDTLIPSPVNGQSRAYLIDTGLYYLYAGGTWQSVDSGTVTPNMSTEVSGKGQKSTVADAKLGVATGVSGGPNVITADVLQDPEVSTATSAGAADGGKIIKTAPNGKVKSTFLNLIPKIIKFGVGISRGSSTTQFDITNPSGTTFRLTWDGTGTNPNINETNFPVGSWVRLMGSNFNANNTGNFLITGVGTNYVEFDNASGVVESNKVIGTGIFYSNYGSVYLGDSTTQFDVTNISGTTYRYAYDATGTDPVINSNRIKVGDVVDINLVGATAANNGAFTVTGIGNNYLEVNNPSGVAEINKTIGSAGYFRIGAVYNPSSSDVVNLIMEGVGGGGDGAGATGLRNAGQSGSSGGYAKKTYQSVTNAFVFIGSHKSSSSGTIEAPSTKFNSSVIMNGGLTSATNSGPLPLTGGLATGGDINLQGGHSQGAAIISGASGTGYPQSGNGGSNPLGQGGVGVAASTQGENATGAGAGGSGACYNGSSGSAVGGLGTDGQIIITELLESSL